MNRDLGHPIAFGRTAEIYAWQNDQVLKLFFDWFALDGIEYEARIARAIHASGLPVPTVGEIVRVNDRNGLVYQRVDGVSMGEILSRKPWTAIRHARKMAELHARMHTSTIQANIIPQRQKLTGKIDHAQALPTHLRAEILTSLKGLPDGDQVCHGDFHPGNILLAAQGEIIIDWIDASRGNPLADVARTTILIRGSVTSRRVGSALLKLFTHTFDTAYVRRYFILRPGGEDEYRRWLPVVAAARLSENITELEPWLIAQAKRRS